MPVEARNGKGAPSVYDVPACIAWLRENDVRRALERAERAAVTDDLDALRARRLAVQIERESLELAKAKGEVCRVDEHFQRIAHVVTLIRVNVLNAPARAVLQLIGETDETRFKAVLRAELIDALQRATDELIEEAAQIAVAVDEAAA